MKGIVFSFGKMGKRKSFFPNFHSVLKRNSVLVFFASALFAGLISGAVYAGNADTETIKSLDFLFTTNLDARLTQGALETFCACFASDFAFLFGAYLFGLSLWGTPFVAALTLFKGFGTGLTAGYLTSSYALSGMGFYLLVLLPGTFLFCVSLVIFSSSAFIYSKKVFIYTLSKNPPEVFPRREAEKFTSKFLSYLIITFLASALDTVLWTLFAGTFKF